MARPAYTDSEYESVRENLTVGALKLFSEIGPDKLSLRKLADFMGVSHTLLYRYFDSKEALFRAIRLESLKKLHEMLRNCDEQNRNENPIARIRAAAYVVQSFSTEYRKEYRFLFSTEQPDLEVNEPLLSLRHEVFDHIVAIAKEAKQQGQISIDARTWVHIVWATMHGILALNESRQLVEGRTFNKLFDSALELLLSER
ncbi:TetR/AcrR family transcriptional regulator [Alteromonas sp. M12]|uniref:TetR/AcrR family transcriptional regulator n=1 Tax=Alteromonas sp. M12 TaxID=3135644 RepID=UPI00319E286F